MKCKMNSEKLNSKKTGSKIFHFIVFMFNKPGMAEIDTRVKFRKSKSTLGRQGFFLLNKISMLQDRKKKKLTLDITSKIRI